LTFAEHVHGFIALDGLLRRVEGSQPQARVHPAFHESVILFHHIVQVFALPEHTAFREHALLLKGIEGRRIGRVFVDGNHTRSERM
jgi:hypothetical protein